MVSCESLIQEHKLESTGNSGRPPVSFSLQENVLRNYHMREEVIPSFLSNADIIDPNAEKIN
jgi:hypothetical protein